MNETALQKLIDYCVLDPKNDASKYYESVGIIEMLKVQSNEKVVLQTKNVDKISCKKENDHLHLTGEKNKTSLTKEVSSNADLINFLQNFKGGYLDRAKNRWNGKLYKANFSIINSFYPKLPYDPDTLSLNDSLISLSYEKGVYGSVFPVSIRLNIKPNENGSGYVMVINLFDGYLFSEINSYDKLAPNYDEISNLDSNVRKTYKLTPENFQELVNYTLFNYPDILKENLKESYSKTESLERLDIIEESQ